MRKLVVLIACVVLGWACAPSPEKQAQSLLEKSAEAHGGLATWEGLSAIKFTKWTKLLQENGQVESEVTQQIEFRFQPYLEGKISWVSDSISHRITFDGTNLRYFMGENEVQNQGFLDSKRKEFDAAYYTLAQPWNLLKEGNKLHYEGNKNLENGLVVESILVDYGPDSDTWWYYFDPQNFKLLGSEVQLKDHRSLVYDLTYEEVEGLIFHGSRESWRVDEQGEKLFKRAEYLYSNYEVVK